MAQAVAVWGRAVTSLRYRDFRLVWLGSLTEHLGEWLEIAGFIWLARDLTASPLMITLVGFSRFFPMIFVPILGGVVADRVNRRNLLVASLIGAIALSLVLFVLVFTGAVTLWHLFLIGLGQGIATSFNHPARQAMVPNLVQRQDLMNAISLDTISVMGSILISAPIAGVIIDVWDVSPLFALRALGAVGAILWLLLIRTPLLPPPQAKGQSPWQNLAGGFSYLREHTTIFILVCLYILPMASVRVYQDLLSVFARDVLKVGGFEYGLLNAAGGLGAVASLLALAALGDYRHKGWLMLISGFAMGLTMIAYGASRWLGLSLFLLVVMGGMRTGLMTLNTALIQVGITDEVRGRVMSMREIAMGLGPLGGVMAGAIAEYTGAPLAMEIMGGLSFLVVIFLALLLPQLRNMK